ncbi:multimerin-2 isoform X2 [Python bivittatus]|uniref:Multimerin-2 isoform X2 n=1 Tax=Python bivittatus TaxID=176946 RepID=A0A9F5J0N3_PYTBI|nr:multimerin-2 isoform X2 [Python bivittatus]
MLTTILLLCGAVGLLKSDMHSRYPGYHHPRQGPEVHQMPTPPQPSSPAEEFWRRESVQEETSNTEAEAGDSYPGSQQPRNENWCSSVQSRTVTYVAVCKTEKYIIRSQQPCPNGTPDCQKVMYRTALKPVYMIKQKVASFLHWKCCPGYVGKNCEQYDPALFPVDTSQPEPWEEAFSNHQTHQSHEALLEDLQNDVHQMANSLGNLQKVLHHNGTHRNGPGGMNQDQSEVQQMLFLHINSFLKEHFNPVWASFNKSLQDLSIAVQNLSQNVEANRKSIERFQESFVPRKDFQELGTKFESKVQANVLRADQMKREMDRHYHLQQAVINYNLTMIKADTDLKLKRHQKMQQSFLLALNNSMADMRQEQNKLHDELEVLNRNFALFPRKLGNQNEVFTDIHMQSLNQTLQKHAQELKKLDQESEKDYEELTHSITRLKDSSKRDIEDFRVRLIEGSLMIDEYREDVERKILVLNNSLAGIQESHWNLQKSMKACCCENQPSSTDIEDLTNTTQMHGEHIKHLEARLKDLAAAFPLIHQSLDFQQEQSRKLEGGMSLLKTHSEALFENVDVLKKASEKMHGHIKYLNSSFNSLLGDAVRHETALEVLLGEEIMELLSEEELIPSTDQLPVMSIKLITDNLKKQSMALESLKERIHSLETDHEHNPHTHKSLKDLDTEKQMELNPQHSRVEYMEPNHEAAMEDALDNPAYHDIMTLKREIGHLTKEMKKYELQWDHIHFCCNQTKANLEDLLSVSMQEVREDLVSAKQNFEEHLEVFQKLFGNSKELAASNVSLDVAKLQLLMSRKMRKQLKVQGQQNMRDKKRAHGHREGTLNGRSRINAETLEAGTAVAFYVQYAEDKEQQSVFNSTYLNYGGGYSHEHGYFKTSHSGVYMVAVSAEFPPGPALGQLVVSNGHRMTLIHNKKRKSSGGYTTLFALVELEKEDLMWFELVQGAAVRQNPVGLSMAGFLLFKT